jgi:hypothetical protein
MSENFPGIQAFQRAGIEPLNIVVPGGEAILPQLFFGVAADTGDMDEGFF